VRLTVGRAGRINIFINGNVEKHQQRKGRYDKA
jgi:hypothetical protein